MVKVKTMISMISSPMSGMCCMQVKKERRVPNLTITITMTSIITITMTNKELQ